MKNKIIIGLTTSVLLFGKGKKKHVTAKVDTGATKTSIDFKALGCKDGLKGGRARTKKLTPEKHSEIAKKTAKSRWQK